jgi:hypothetical protein
VIAASSLLSALRERLPQEGELLTFTDGEPIQALQTILDARPSLIVLERLFAATPRGAALINRIKTDPQLAACEVRVMSHTGDYTRTVARPAVQPGVAMAAAVSARATAPESAPPAPVIAEPPPRQLDWRGTRRAQRSRVRPGTEIQLEGAAVSVVDISSIGAQVVSGGILRPNQRVRVAISHDDAVMRFRGTIAWAAFELPKAGAPPVYRAGVEFLDADARAMDAFIARVRTPPTG